MHDPRVDLVLVFSVPHGPSRQQARDEAAQAQQQYARLLQKLSSGRLRAVSRPGDQPNQLLVFVQCPDVQLARLAHRERHSDFIHGVTSSTLPEAEKPLDLASLSSSDRLRLVYSYLTSTPADGGLGVSTDAPEWSRVTSILALHDTEFNERWLRSLANKQIGSQHLDTIRSQFGENVAFYFAFLGSYTSFLLPISLVGALFYKLGTQYSLVYSSILVLWTTVFVETWRIRERIFAVRWSTLGSFRVEKRRASYVETKGTTWWQRELRTLASVPVILVFAAALFTLLTSIFVFEAFVTHIYTGPGHEYIGFAPTVLFMGLVPRLLAFYHKYAVRLTNWEDHRHHSTYLNSLTIKTFALSGLVAYLGLTLSAFVYVPFGATIMTNVQHALEGTTLFDSLDGKARLFDTTASASSKLSTSRLQNQMYAITVTNQGINFFIEVALPFIQRFISGGISASRQHRRSTSSGTKKRVGFEDEDPRTRAERNFLDRVRREVARPDYDTFGDYSEMVTQLGYVALWSALWPLAPACAWVNNIVELRSDAFKIVTHHRRPIPVRADTVGPWLTCLEALAWAGALVNAALVFLFHPSAASADDNNIHRPGSHALQAALVALGASHAFLVVRAAVRHILERVLWRGSKEARVVEDTTREVKERYLTSIDVPSPDGDVRVKGAGEATPPLVESESFWSFDAGVEEIERVLKEA